MQPSNKKHLPVLKPPDTSDEAPQSPLLWTAYACIVTLSVWVPLVIASLKIATHLGNAWLHQSGPSEPVSARPTIDILAAVLVLGSFGLACTLGGLVLGRFSLRARPGHAVVFSVGTVAIVLVFAALGNALRPVALGAAVAVSLGALGTAGGLVGYGYGRRHRAP